ncbi:MAG TPA: hypothetical protein VHD90_16955 [Phototrophicaceae bacterium]|nr:hypothetical protein [Phototrophicaceae bacterium]
MALLEGLDYLDWASIHHSHDMADEFPFYLRELAQNDPKTWQDAWSYIHEYSTHQESTYQVTPYVAPFLVELLQALPSRTVKLLWTLACLSANAAENSSVSAEWRANFSTDEEADANWPENRAYHQYVEDTRAYLAMNLEIFIPYLDHEDANVRRSAAILLVPFYDVFRVRTALNERYHIEKDSRVLRAIEKGF